MSLLPDLLPFELAAPRVPCKCPGAGAASPDDGIEQFLLNVGRDIIDATILVEESAEEARAQLQGLRLFLHGAVDARCDEIGRDLQNAAAAKATALERELIDVDAVLERWREDSAAVIRAATFLSDADFELQRTSLSSRLDGMEALMQAIPTVVVEPPVVGLVADATALLAAIACFGRVLAPIAITATDLSLRRAPNFIQPGELLHLHLSFSARHAAQSAEEVAVSLRRLVGMTVVDATLVAPGVEAHPLGIAISYDDVLHALLILLRIPATAAAGDRVVVSTITVAGHAAAAAFSVLVRRGMQTPLLLLNAAFETMSPCISPDGLLFVPPGQGPAVLVFDAEGAPRPALSFANGCLAQNTKWAAYAPGNIPSLLLAEGQRGPCRVLSLDLLSHTVRWSLHLKDVLECGGIAALPAQGVAVVNSHGNDTLFIHRLVDGARTGGVQAILSQPASLGWFLAANPATGAVFGTYKTAAGHVVHAWSCAADNSLLTDEGSVAAAGQAVFGRPLAVVPPAPGKTMSHLVVATVFSSELLILALPDLTLVHTHSLEGVAAWGLAADPWGGALAVCDAESEAIRVLAWPLPGMPLLA